MFSADGRFLAALVDPSSLAVWDTGTGQRIASLAMPQGSQINGGMFSPDGRCLVLEIEDGSAAVYELATLQRRRSFAARSKIQSNALQRDIGVQTGPRLAVSPDGRLLVHAAMDRTIRVWDLRTGKELSALNGHSEPINAVAMSPDGTKIASASDDSTGLIWDLTKLERPAAPPKPLAADELEKCWQALLSDDAAKAFEAMCQLWAAPADAVALLRDRVQPAMDLDMKRIDGLIAQFDSNQYKVRRAAGVELLQTGERLIPIIQKALVSNPTLETKLQLEDLRSKLTGVVLQGDRLRTFRAVEILEGMGTPEARKELQRLAAGARGALLTTSTQKALKRMQAGGS
jgi:hypothetical protein